MSVNKPIEGVTASLINDDLNQWLINIIGPKDTPYEGGNFKILLTF